ncbi:MAG TPA: HEPN domain-containing protein [Candidatus Korarchaeota archaeon]|nr:HEPN domain-containing protein [Candidatus Korarchaeota archaeon]
MLDEEEYNRWMSSARHTLRSARRDLEGGDYNWACFKAQQAAEFALKAYLWGVGRPAFGQSLLKLSELIGDVPEDVRDACARLDKFYTAPRYAYMWSEGAPHEYYTRREAEESIYYAEAIMRFVEEKWRSLRGEGGSGRSG